MSRLARSCKDWHHLLELCGRFRVLLADAESIYDPTEYSDRLLLGLTGMMNEAELHILKQRMYQGKLNKARRGELVVGVPVGYVKSPAGEVTFDPDEQVQEIVRLVFDQFDRQGTVHGVLRHLIACGIRMPLRRRSGPESRGTGLAASGPGDRPPHPPPSDLCRSLYLWIPSGRSAAAEARKSRERPRQRAGRGGMPGLLEGPAPGVHQLGPVRGEPEADGGEPVASRVGRRSPGRGRLAGGGGAVRAMRASDVRALQAERRLPHVRLQHVAVGLWPTPVSIGLGDRCRGLGSPGGPGGLATGGPGRQPRGRVPGR